MDVASEWDARAERDVGVMMRRYLADNPPPDASRIADDLADWADRLVADGEGRLRLLGAREDERGAREEAQHQAGTDLGELALDVRTYNALKRVGVQTVEELAGLTDGQVRAVPGIGPKSTRCVHEALSTFAAQHYAGTDAPDWSRLLGEEDR